MPTNHRLSWRVTLLAVCLLGWIVYASFFVHINDGYSAARFHATVGGASYRPNAPFANLLSTRLGQADFSPAQSPAPQVARRVYVPGLFSLSVSQQPSARDVYVTPKRNLITQYRLPLQDGITGLLAHNYLAGAQFYRLTVGQELWVVYSDRQVRRYEVTAVQRYQKVAPADLRSDLIDVDTQQQYTSTEVYQRYYTGEHHVTFQTCLESEGRLNWGLYFVVAEPREKSR